MENCTVNQPPSGATAWTFKGFHYSPGQRLALQPEALQVFTQRGIVTPDPVVTPEKAKANDKAQEKNLLT